MDITVQDAPAARGDLLGELLEPLRLRGVFAAHWTAQAPWGMRGNQEQNAILHYVRSGEAAVTAPGASVVLRQGDLAVFPHGTAHDLADRPGRSATSLDVLIPVRAAGTTTRVRVKGSGPTTEILCGGLHYDEAAVSPLYRALPEILVLDAEMLAGEPLLAGTLHRLAEGARPEAPGSRLVSLRAYELAFVLSLRVALERLSDTVPALRALNHPQISRVLLAIQARYAEPWTLHTLAREAAMSRSALAATFHRLVGQTPIRYLTERRMQVAAQLLADTRVPLTVVADRVGYRSPVGFHLAFRRFFRRTPGEHRRAARAQVLPPAPHTT
ncbi:AraC family transcriptional regulator [Allokutzneria sp. A3M-2-11 16]|uniref:AraC family transcriptional regulator n=1 Tax=Allokutzneria sp. A3M-2-11 16 TaxID=2962043 RepID=UPI0020B6BBE4|nr:AraC family transcriptional regulator [Allokutzneria sp. A3M-2-11 16]MCP3805068.1 AraC family transcriptional regulator [Allokutzneria sp. A3M-2-11 16]